MRNIKSIMGSSDFFKAQKALNRVTRIVWIVFRALLLLGLSFIILYPLLYMISMTFRPTEQLYNPSVIWIPRSLTLENLKNAFELMKYPQSLLLSLRTNIVSSFLQIAVCAFTGYGFARFRFKGKNLLFIVVLITIMVPPSIISIPTYLTFKTIGILDTALSFYLPAALGAGLKSGLFIFIFRQFFRGLPVELEDAASIDGCGFLGCFLRIIIPNAGSVFVMTILLSTMWYWNDYFTSSMYYSSQETVTVALVNLQHQAALITGGATADPYQIITLMQAGSLLTILPLLIVYIILQKQFVQGVERSGIVG